MAVEWTLLLFTLLAGSGAALLACSCAAELAGVADAACRAAQLLSMVLLVVGALAAILHLGYPDEVLKAFRNLAVPANLSMELALTLASVGVAYLAVYARQQRASMGARRAVAVLGAACGLTMCYVLGASYVLLSRPAWDSPTLVLAYAASALSMGCCLFLALAVFLHAPETDLRKVALAGFGCAVAQALGFALYLVFLSTAQAADPTQVHLVHVNMLGVLAGDHGAVFWVGYVGLGMLGMLVCAAGNLAALRPRGGVRAASSAARVARQAAVPCVTVAVAMLGGLAMRCCTWYVSYGFIDLLGNQFGVLL